MTIAPEKLAEFERLCMLTPKPWSHCGDDGANQESATACLARDIAPSLIAELRMLRAAALNLYHDDYDFILAMSPAHATQVWEAHIGEKRAEHGKIDADWKLYDKSTLTINEEPGRGNNGAERTQFIFEWAAECGACFLSSTEY